MPPKLAKRIRTLVFLDFETTGLPNDTPMRATELSMLAMDRDEFEATTKSFSLRTPRLPRVQNKLTLCFNPLRPIHYRASHMTGLSNENTKNQPPFDPLASSLIRAFLGRFLKPLCLIAHNGRRFDFPLLMSEASDLEEDWEDDVYCADSMIALGELEGYAYTSVEVNTNNVFLQSLQSWRPGSVDHISPKTACSEAVPTIPTLPSTGKLCLNTASQIGQLPIVVSPSIVSETTIDNSQSYHFSSVLAPSNLQQSMDLVSESHVTKRLVKTVLDEHGYVVEESVDVEETSVTMIKNQNLETVPANRGISASNGRPKVRKNFGSVSLPKIYERLFGAIPDGSHGAEDDVKSMALCCLAVKEPFLQWIDENSTLIKDVKGFW